MTIPRCCPTCGNWHTGGVCAKTVTNGVTIESGFIPAKKSYEQLERELSGAKAELSALRAAQPLTCKHERVEMLAHIDHETVGAVGTDFPLSWSPIWRNCGDDVPAQAALLDSLADGDQK